ncbi:MAG: MerC domain-containing protein [Gammaproteobacteria bacterium]|nr:MerC domain-containing protein [Gammaproteobacteria bacterium]
MREIITLVDKVAVGLSFLCVAHCLLLPVAVLVLPVIGATLFEGEKFHFWLLFLVVPASFFSLGLGCRKHGRMNILWLGLLGVFTLSFVVMLGEDLLGETLEKLSTMLGAIIVAVAHFRNSRACRNFPSCKAIH